MTLKSDIDFEIDITVEMINQGFLADLKNVPMILEEVE